MTGVGGDSSLSPFVCEFKLDTEDPADLVTSDNGLDLFGSNLGFSTSSFRKLERKSLVRSATDGGFSGKGGAGPLELVGWGNPRIPNDGFVSAMLFKSTVFSN